VCRHKARGLKELRNLDKVPSKSLEPEAKPKPKPYDEEKDPWYRDLPAWLR
jgi:hypothetical protein